MMTNLKIKIATTSLAGCFGCHMYFLKMDGYLTELLEHMGFSRLPLTDIKHCGPCDIGLTEDSMCTTENVHVLHHSSTPKVQ